MAAGVQQDSLVLDGAEAAIFSFGPHEGFSPPAMASLPDKYSQETETVLQRWLSFLGLHFDPFRALDAGSDPWVHAYLVDHGTFTSISTNRPSFVFAPAGGGKSAFRVRLARECRVTQRAFPVTYLVPSPAVLGGLKPDYASHLAAICAAMAGELLLEVMYRPQRFETLPPGAQVEVRHALDWNLPGRLDYFLRQLEWSGNLSPLIEAFDPTAQRLVGPPDSASIRQLCARLRDLNSQPPAPTAESRFDHLVRLAADELGFKAVYVLIDGLDAHIETSTDPRAGLMLLRPLLRRTAALSQRRIYLKYFLPEEAQAGVNALPEAWMENARCRTVRWRLASLTEVIGERLRVASGGMFCSLDAVSEPGLRNLEASLVRMAGRVPREVLAAVEQLLLVHVRRVGATGKLSREDLEELRRLRSWASRQG